MIKNAVFYASLMVCLWINSTSLHGQITDISFGYGIVLQPTTQSTSGNLSVINHSGPHYALDIDFKLFNSPFRFSTQIASPRIDLHDSKTVNTINNDQSNGSFDGFSLLKAIPVIHQGHKALTFFAGLTYAQTGIQPTNTAFSNRTWIDLTNPDGQVRSNSTTAMKQLSDQDYHLFLTTAVEWNQPIWKGLYVGAFGKYDYGFGAAITMDYYNRTSNTQPIEQIAPSNQSHQQLHVLLNYITLGLRLGVNL